MLNAARNIEPQKINNTQNGLTKTTGRGNVHKQVTSNIFSVFKNSQDEYSLGDYKITYKIAGNDLILINFNLNGLSKNNISKIFVKLIHQINLNNKTKINRIVFGNKIKEEKKAIVISIITKNFPLIEITRIYNNSNIVNIYFGGIKYLNDHISQKFVDTFIDEIKILFQIKFDIFNKGIKGFKGRSLRSSYKHFTLLFPYFNCSNPKECIEKILFDGINDKKELIDIVLNKLDEIPYFFQNNCNGKSYDEIKKMIHKHFKIGFGGTNVGNINGIGEKMEKFYESETLSRNNADSNKLELNYFYNSKNEKGDINSLNDIISEKLDGKTFEIDGKKELALKGKGGILRKKNKKSLNRKLWNYGLNIINERNNINELFFKTKLLGNKISNCIRYLSENNIISSKILSTLINSTSNIDFVYNGIKSKIILSDGTLNSDYFDYLIQLTNDIENKKTILDNIDNIDNLLKKYFLVLIETIENKNIIKKENNTKKINDILFFLNNISGIIIEGSEMGLIDNNEIGKMQESIQNNIYGYLLKESLYILKLFTNKIEEIINTKDENKKIRLINNLKKGKYFNGEEYSSFFKDNGILKGLILFFVDNLMNKKYIIEKLGENTTKQLINYCEFISHFIDNKNFSTKKGENEELTINEHGIIDNKSWDLLKNKFQSEFPYFKIDFSNIKKTSIIIFEEEQNENNDIIFLQGLKQILNSKQYENIIEFDASKISKTNRLKNIQIFEKSNIQDIELLKNIIDYLNAISKIDNKYIEAINVYNLFYDIIKKWKGKYFEYHGNTYPILIDNSSINPVLWKIGRKQLNNKYIKKIFKPISLLNEMKKLIIELNNGFDFISPIISLQQDEKTSNKIDSQIGKGVIDTKYLTTNYKGTYTKEGFFTNAQNQGLNILIDIKDMGVANLISFMSSVIKYIDKGHNINDLINASDSVTQKFIRIIQSIKKHYPNAIIYQGGDEIFINIPNYSQGNIKEILKKIYSTVNEQGMECRMAFSINKENLNDEFDLLETECGVVKIIEEYFEKVIIKKGLDKNLIPSLISISLYFINDKYDFVRELLYPDLKIQNIIKDYLLNNGEKIIEKFLEKKSYPKFVKGYYNGKKSVKFILYQQYEGGPIRFKGIEIVRETTLKNNLKQLFEEYGENKNVPNGFEFDYGMVCHIDFRKIPVGDHNMIREYLESNSPKKVSKKYSINEYNIEVVWEEVENGKMKCSFNCL